MALPQDTRFDCGARMKIVINDVTERVVVEFIPEHSHSISTTHPNRLHRSHSTIHLTNTVRCLVVALNSEGIRLRI